MSSHCFRLYVRHSGPLRHGASQRLEHAQKECAGQAKHISTDAHALGRSGEQCLMSSKESLSSSPMVEQLHESCTMALRIMLSQCQDRHHLQVSCPFSTVSPLQYLSPADVQGDRVDDAVPAANKAGADRLLGYGEAKRPERKPRTSLGLPHRTVPPVQFASRVRNARYESARATPTSMTSKCQEQRLSKCEFEFCRQRLRSAFQRCTDLEFLRVSVIVSCLLHSFRALHILEVVAVLMFVVGNEPGGKTCDESDIESNVRHLQVKCSEIFFLDPAGFVRFAHPLISKFLLSYPIRGIDRGHAVLAKACVTQIEFDGGIPEFSKVVDVSSEAKKGRLSSYAARHWEDHYRFEERRNASVTAQVRRMLWTEIAKNSKCSGCGIFEGDGRRQSLQLVREYCVGKNFQVLSTTFSQLIAHDMAMERAEGRRDASPEGQTEPLDHALAGLELESESESSDGWALI